MYGFVGTLRILPTFLKDTFCHVQRQAPLSKYPRDLLLLMLISHEWGWDTFYAPVVCYLWGHETRELSIEAAFAESKTNGKNVKILWNVNAAWSLIRKQDTSDIKHHVWVPHAQILINWASACKMELKELISHLGDVSLLVHVSYYWHLPLQLCVTEWS